MKYYAKRDQVSYGEAIGIILMDTFTPFIPGDVGNATTFSFPVRYKVVSGLTSEQVLHHDMSCLDKIIDAGRELVREGVKAITGDCGYMALYQSYVAKELGVPVFLSSLLQVPFLISMLGGQGKIGVVCANSLLLTEEILESAGISSSKSIIVRGLQEQPNFKTAMLDEEGVLDFEQVQQEVVTTALQLIEEESDIKMLLLECSDLPPYGVAVQQAVKLPVFDFVTMINYVYSGLVKKPFNGYM